MTTDYHVHLERGPFTLEWLGEFVRQADKAGVEDLGISEHTFAFSEFQSTFEHLCDNNEAGYPEIRRWLSESFKHRLKDYIDLVEAGRRMFGRNIKLGLEADYFPGCDEVLSLILREYEFDYILGSVHFLGLWGFDISPELGWSGRDVDEVYCHYFAVLTEMVSSGLFDIVAHPDVIKVFGHRPDLPMLSHFDDLAEVISRQDMAVEVSTAGLRKPVREMYPSKELLSSFCRRGVPIVLCSDAHEPGDVGFMLSHARHYARDAGYTENATYSRRRRTLHSLLA